MEYREIKYRREISGSVFAEMTARDWDGAGEPEYAVRLMVFGKEADIPQSEIGELICSLEKGENEVSPFAREVAF